MLAQQSLITELEDAINSGSADRRTDTLRRVCDLFETGASMYSDEQVELFDDVIGRLAASIEATARAELSNRLAPIANAPVNIVRTLAADDLIEVAGPVLAQCARLDDDDLIGTARSKSQQHLLAIAQRASLSEAVTDVLVTRGDRAVVHSVAGNDGARFSDAAFGVLVERATGDDTLAQRVGLRLDIPRRHFGALIAKASETVQRKLMAANPQAAEHIRHVVADIEGKMKAAQGRDYTAARARVEALHQAGKLGESEVHSFAKSGKFEETAVALALLCGLPVDAVEQAMLDERPDMLLILAKAIGYCWATAKLLLLLRMGGRGASQHDLELALHSFDRLQVSTAQRAVRFYQTRQTAVPAAG
ncbi:MAG TPA: DUF2336 domain-containing protein [Xanthobacteraceae bacterium]|nr:DUF2336 domain-containing protein [Xanthobacteraceae bacterium]